MRFATILLLATAVAGLRVQHTHTAKKIDPVEAEKKFEEEFDKCDTSNDDHLSKAEAIACAEANKAPDAVVDFIKEKYSEDGYDKDEVKKFLWKNRKEIIKRVKKAIDEAE